MADRDLLPRGIGRVVLGLCFGATLLLAACSSDESGVLTADGSIIEVGAAGGAGSAGSDAGASAEGSSEGAPGEAAVTTDAMGDAAASDVSNDAGAMCNTVVNVAMPVTPTAGAGAAPALTGGMITDGTYVETKVEQFGGDGGLPPTEQSTIVLASGTLSEVVKVGTVETRYFSTYTVMMTTLNIVTTCDSTFKFTGAYSAQFQANTTTFIYSFDSNGGKLVKTYTKK